MKTGYVAILSTLSFLAILTGVCFKLQHWDNASNIMICGIVGQSLALLLLKSTSKKNLAVIFILSVIVVLYAFIYKNVDRTLAAWSLGLGMVGHVICWLLILIKAIRKQQKIANVNK